MKTLILAAAFAAVSFAAVAAESEGDATRGKRLFVENGCYACHGYVGQGGPGLRLAPNPPPPAVIAAYIRNPAGEMPPISAKLVNDQAVRDIHAYLASVPAPPKLDDISLLKAGN